MKFKEFVKALKKRIVLIPLGTLAAIATIIGVIHQLQPANKDFEKLILEYVITSNNLKRFQVNEKLSSDSTIIRMERIQSDIELYIRSIAKIDFNPDENINLEKRIAIAKQNLLIIMDGYDIAQRCKYDLLDLALNADSLVLSDIGIYISFQKIDNSIEEGDAFNKYLNKKEAEIDEFANIGNQEKMIKSLEQIFASNELEEYLFENKSLYVDMYDSLNLMKRKYQQRSELRQ